MLEEVKRIKNEMDIPAFLCAIESGRMVDTLRLVDEIRKLDTKRQSWTADTTHLLDDARRPPMPPPAYENKHGVGLPIVLDSVCAVLSKASAVQSSVDFSNVLEAVEKLKAEFDFAAASDACKQTMEGTKYPDVLGGFEMREG